MADARAAINWVFKGQEQASLATWYNAKPFKPRASWPGTSCVLLCANRIDKIANVAELRLFEFLVVVYGVKMIRVALGIH